MIDWHEVAQSLHDGGIWWDAVNAWLIWWSCAADTHPRHV
jgi:hypothetical protein